MNVLRDERDERAVPPVLEAFFQEHPRLALAFSGGVDSAYLLYAVAAVMCGRIMYSRPFSLSLSGQMPGVWPRNLKRICV